MFNPRSIKHCRCLRRAGALRRARRRQPRARHCTVCGTIHYENPLNVVGTVPVWQDQVLLCRRNIERRATGCGRCRPASWSFGETLRDGALREPSGSRRPGRDAGLYTLLNVVRVGGAFLLRAAVSTRAFRPRPETIEARLFREDEIPWGADRLPHRENPEALVRRPPPGSIRLPHGRYRLIAASAPMSLLSRPRTPPGHQGRHAAPAYGRPDPPDPLLDCLVELCRLHGRPPRAPRCRRAAAARRAPDHRAG